MAIDTEKENQFKSRFHEYTRTLDCVHCGLCIPYCPTHGVTGREADSPRGRIYLMREYAESGVDLSAEAHKHLNQCIVCRACETVCPSGIRMGDMMESFREEMNLTQRPKGLGHLLARFLLRYMLPYRNRIAAVSDLLYFYQRSGLGPIVSLILRCFFKRAAALDQLQPKVPAPSVRRIETDLTRPEGYPAEGKARLRVGLFLGCITSEWFAPAHRATIRVLQKNGCDVVLPDRQTCCGALHRHGGFLEDATELYRKNAEIFSKAGVDVVVVNAAGCGAALKEPPHSLPGGLGVPVRDVCEFLEEIGVVPPSGPIKKKVTHHQACHLVHGQRLKASAVENLLRTIPELELVPLTDSDRCCGSGGVYNLIHPEMAEPVLEDKVRAIVATGAEIVVTGNPGCAMQVRAGLQADKKGQGIEVTHPVELLDRSYSSGSPLR